MPAGPYALGLHWCGDSSHWFQAAYAAQRVLCCWRHWMKRRVFFVILAVVWMVIWQTRLQGLYDGVSFSDYDLICYFKHRLRVKIRCDRKCLDRMTFDERWVKVASLVVRKGPRFPMDTTVRGPLQTPIFGKKDFLSFSNCVLVSWPCHLALKVQVFCPPRFFSSPSRLSSFVIFLLFWTLHSESLLLLTATPLIFFPLLD